MRCAAGFTAGRLTVASAQDSLFKGLQGKLPKGVAACVAVLLQAVRFATRAGDAATRCCGRALTRLRCSAKRACLQVFWRARHQAVPGAQGVQPAAGPQGQERSRWREGVGGAHAASCICCLCAEDTALHRVLLLRLTCMLYRSSRWSSLDGSGQRPSSAISRTRCVTLRRRRCAQTLGPICGPA